jgi:hypothetical protein
MAEETKYQVRSDQKLFLQAKSGLPSGSLSTLLKGIVQNDMVITGQQLEIWKNEVAAARIVFVEEMMDKIKFADDLYDEIVDHVTKERVK